MTKHSLNLNEPATKEDLRLLQRQLQQLEKAILAKVEQLPQKQYYTVAEFAYMTGQGKAAVQKLCYSGEIKATQLKKGGTWSIYATELDRLKKEAMENHFAESKQPTRRHKAIMKKVKEGKL